MTDFRELRRIPSLDGIRAMAALMVMVFHFVGHRGEPSQLKQLVVIGQTGVDLFFVLSGFLITRILLLSKNSSHYFRSFYVRRSLRIFPLYYLFLVLYFFVLPGLYSAPIPSFASQTWSWFYLQNLPGTFPGLTSSGPEHFWSLAVEEHFYLVWPLLIFLLSRRQFMCLIAGILVGAPFVRLLFLANGWGVFYFTLTRMDALGYGALLAALLTDPAGIRRYCIPIFRILLLGLPVLLLPGFILLSGCGAAWLQIMKLSLIPAVYFALIGFCLIDPLSGPLRSLFSWRGLGWLGSISYGLYVFHPSCFALVNRFLAPAGYPADMAASFGLTILVAALSFRFLETPMRNLSRHFQYESGSNV